MRRNGYLWTSGVNLDTAIRFADTDFIIECKISTMWRRFPLSFAFYMLNPRRILFLVCLTYWRRKYTTRVDPTSLIPTKFEVDMTIHCRVRPIAFLSADTSRDLMTSTFDLLTFWPWTVDVHRGHVTKLATKFEDPKPIRSWLMSYNVSRWLPLKMRTRPLRMRRITWPVSRGSKQLHFWNPRPRFAYSLYNFYWAPMTIKGRLLVVSCRRTKGTTAIF